MAVFLFPGQGSQQVGMGRDLYEHYPEVRDLYDQAVEALGFDLRRISFEGPEEQLKETQLTQPALFVHSVALNLLLGNLGVSPDATAGHSVGEYSAVVAAGALDFIDALKVVKVRGELMSQAGQMAPGAMAAILGATENQIQQICEDAAAAGVIVPANLNSPGQVVLSGHQKAIDQAIKLAGEMGLRRAIKLNVSGAFHSPLMSSARQGLHVALDSVDIQDSKVPVYQNLTAKPERSAARIRENLLLQLENPVRW
ncbi:MAG: ACP S-malonyltransferase, partial [Fidelibacterota bacterium]